MEIIFRNTVKRFCHLNKYILNKRSFMTSSPRMQEELEKLKTNPYFEKYAQKIATLQQTSPEEFLARVDTNAKSKQPKPEKPEKQFTSLLKPKEQLKEKSEEKDESLDKIMKLELIQDKSAEEITKIWQEYHIQKDVIAATVPADDYNVIYEHAIKHPIFLFPIPRSQGFEFIMAQFQRNSVHFTPLICYQVHKENAPECLTIIHYTELKDSKGIVLMRGEYDTNVISGREAQCLANQLQMYYNGKDTEKKQLLESFTAKPDAFKHMDLIKQIENISLQDVK